MTRLFEVVSLFIFNYPSAEKEWRIRRSTIPFQGVNVSACSQMQKTESWGGGSKALAFDFCWISSRCALCQVREVIGKEEWRKRNERKGCGERFSRLVRQSADYNELKTSKRTQTFSSCEHSENLSDEREGPCSSSLSTILFLMSILMLISLI